MTTTRASTIRIPPDLLPADGRFGSGPSRVRPEAVRRLAEVADGYLGTSHRRSTVRDQVARLRSGLTRLFNLPDGWEIVLGNGGTTVFWDAAVFGLIERRTQHLLFGEFSAKFADAVRAAPHLDEPEIVETEPGDHPEAHASPGVDAYCLTHNETSTGVTAPVRRPAGTDPGALVLVDATSAAGGIEWDPAEADVYEFAPQKALASEGGLWIAACSPAALERIGRLAASERWIPASLDLAIALDNSRKDQTYNTPALATVFLAAEQVDWLLEQGGLAWAAGRCRESSGHLYRWAQERPFAQPFVADPAKRSPVVCTIDFEGVDAAAIAEVLRANGIVDTEPYRKLGRNQLRIATFPATPPSDIEALTATIDFVVGELG